MGDREHLIQALNHRGIIYGRLVYEGVGVAGDGGTGVPDCGASVEGVAPNRRGRVRICVAGGGLLEQEEVCAEEADMSDLRAEEELQP